MFGHAALTLSNVPRSREADAMTNHLLAGPGVYVVVPEARRHPCRHPADFLAVLQRPASRQRRGSSARAQKRRRDRGR